MFRSAAPAGLFALVPETLVRNVKGDMFLFLRFLKAEGDNKHEQDKQKYDTENG